MKPLYLGFVESIHSFITESVKVLSRCEDDSVTPEGLRKVKELMELVESYLFDILSNFYIKLSKHAAYTQDFEDIEDIKKKCQEIKAKS